jgi:hypothetical protein
MPLPRLCLAVVVLLLVAALMGAPAAQQPTFLGVIDPKGLLTPIAAYGGGDWWNRLPWQPESDPIRLSPPPSLAAIPDE